jgi:rhodanese-related sulfurtransferase
MNAQATRPLPEMVSLDEARAHIAAGRGVLVDIREPMEHARGVAEGALLLPMSQLQWRLPELPEGSAEQPVFVICNTQNRSGAVVSALRQQLGREHVHAVRGGMSEWVLRNLPVVPPSP